MFDHANPKGISIRQAKKDAKKLAKKNDIKLTQAQDIIAFKHNRSTWAVAMQQMKRPPITLKFINRELGTDKITFPVYSSFLSFVGEYSTNKTLLLLEIMEQVLKQQIPVTYLSSGDPITNIEPHPNRNFEVTIEEIRRMFEGLVKKYPEQLNVMDARSESCHLPNIVLNGGLLVIEESQHVCNANSKAEVKDLLLCSKHTLMYEQKLEDFSDEYIPQDILYDGAEQMFMTAPTNRDLDILFQGKSDAEEDDFLENHFSKFGEYTKFSYFQKNATPKLFTFFKPEYLTVLKERQQSELNRE
jgi:hypothetical protein